MEKWTVLGYRKVDFKDEKNDKQISGYSLYLTRPGSDGIIGDEVQKIFVSDDKVDYLPDIGDVIQIFYNRFGKIGDIHVI